MLRFSIMGREIVNERAVKPWRVLHACETTASTAALADAETSVGMNPQVLSREFWNPHAEKNPLSLLTAWNDVRDWRHALNEAEALTSVQIVHAHSFASAMAGVRGNVPLVYDFAETLEETRTHQAAHGAWLLRSFRVAEQFALSRSSAVVAHCEGMKKIANDRGAASPNIFVVPGPIPIREISADSTWAIQRGIDLGYDTVVFSLADPAGFESTLRAFGALAMELERAVFVFECDQPDRELLIRVAREFDIADSLRCVSSDEREQAIGCANVVIVPSTGDAGGRSNHGMLMAMAAGRPVVAADAPENRECSPDGRGCIWFHAGDILDLTQRTAFVARNEDFSRGLGDSGREHIRATRSPEVIGRAYDEIYRFAQGRRSDNLPRITVPKIYALGPI